MLTVGRSQIMPHEMIKSTRFAEVLDEARRDYEWIILDTAPLVLAPDCLMMGRSVDGFVIIVCAHKTSRKEIGEALNILGPSKLLGPGLQPRRQPARIIWISNLSLRCSGSTGGVTSTFLSWTDRKRQASSPPNQSTTPCAYKPFVENILVLGQSHLATAITAEMKKRRRYRILDLMEPGEPGRVFKDGVPFVGSLDRGLRTIPKTHRIVVALSERRGRLPIEALLDAKRKGWRSRTRSICMND